MSVTRGPKKLKVARASTPEPPPEAGPTAAGYAPALSAGVQATVQTVHDVHHAISDKTFDSLQRLPGLSVPTRIVQGVHDAITHSVYAAVRHGSGAVLSMAGAAERLAGDGSGPAQDRERVFRSALNGVFGDALAQAASSLAVQMSFHRDGSALPLTESALAGLGPRVCLFIHGLACDEHSWRRAPDAWEGSPFALSLPARETVHYGALLAQEFGISPIYLRYNTGLAVTDNARQLSDALGTFVSVAPPHLQELVLVGHSMGGLVARSACDVGHREQCEWLARVRQLICLGTPHQGAVLEQLGHITSLALGLSTVTRPLGELANRRSQGIKDLRHGLKARRRGRPAPTPSLALRFIAATLGDESDTLLDNLIGKLLGDGLVMPASASDLGVVGNVQSVELAGMGHMALLNHPRVYARLRAWVAEVERT